MADIRILGRYTQGVRVINLSKRGDEIASVCCVDTDPEEEAVEAIENPEEIPADATVGDETEVTIEEEEADDDELLGDDAEENEEESDDSDNVQPTLF